MIQNPSILGRPPLIDIKKIFPGATGVGVILPEIKRGLVVQFNRRADLFEELKIETPTKNVISQSLFDLVRGFGFVILKNCTALGVKDNDFAKLSGGRNKEERFIQDPFHYDYFPQRKNFVAGICQLTDEGREEDTLYARECDVKDAIRKLSKDGLSDDVVQALDAMAKEDYHFRLYNVFERPARQQIRDYYPEFVEDVFALIPEGRKFRKKWLTGEWDIAMDANIFGDVLHARPTGRFIRYGDSASNPLAGLNISRK